MLSLFYNFPEVSLSLTGIDSSKEIRFPHTDQPVTNIQLNNNNYTAYSIFIASTSTATTTILAAGVVKASLSWDTQKSNFTAWEMGCDAGDIIYNEGYRRDVGQQVSEVAIAIGGQCAMIHRHVVLSMNFNCICCTQNLSSIIIFNYYNIITLLSILVGLSSCPT
jgi:hypothetical protein